ncbi:DUF1761 domain-containing protein [Fulvivirgaceae bacterium BMA10]|uniref:DUF1761 domain-containing protein n=1 Tax=Splendidivirga corallicola TaxID=3051826 RepID=A0ABT8KU70_9BACT|nr:DUF1761 domain-containing protein [Fulvivirgaceae bacterium BMA10]
MPEIQINYLAVIIAVVANFILGFIWYTPLFGRIWAKEMGFDPDEKPPGSVMARGMIFMVIGNFFLAYVFAHNIAVWDPETWGLGPSEMSNIANIASAAFFTWLGFFLPVDLGAVAWEKKSWKLFGINTSYHFLSLVVVAAILIYM